MLIMLICFSGLRGQSTIRISGAVYDAVSGEALAAAFVGVVNSPYGCLSAADGSYAIESLPEGDYELECTRLGYRSSNAAPVSVVIDQTLRHNFYLTSEPIQLDSLQVEALASDVTEEIGARVVLTRTDIERYRVLGLEKLLQQVAGVQVDATGGSGRAVIRIHGGRASQVLVLLDGQKLNDSQTGEIDLGAIPLDDVEWIEVLREGNTALHGGGAFDGVVVFHSREERNQNQLSAGAHTGSFESAGGRAALVLARQGSGIRVSYQQDYSRQNFEYQYEDNTETRQNSWTRHRGFLARGNSTYKSNTFNVLLHRRAARQGLPSFFYSEFNSYNANLRLNQTSLQARHSWLTPKLVLNNSFSVNDLSNTYKNLLDPGFTRFHLEQDNRVYEARIEAVVSVLGETTARFGSSYLEEQLETQNLLRENEDADYNVRHQYAFYGATETSFPGLSALFKHSRLNGALRYERYFRQQGEWYPHINITLVPKHLSQLSLTAGWSKAIRYPDFNSLFWKGDARASGNPELLPERKRAYNAGAKLRFKNTKLPALRIYVYSEDITDLIFWELSVGVWQPRNLSGAEKRGIDIEFEEQFIPEHLHLNATYSFIDTKNSSPEPNRNGKQLIFVPRHTTNLTLWLQAFQFQGQVLWRYVSERQIVQANTGLPLAAYQLLDLSVNHDLQFKRWRLQTGLAIKNITGESYELIRGYPMPGREFRLTLQIENKSH